jgi:hypothetical protein
MKKYHKISLSLLAFTLILTGGLQLYSIRPKQLIVAASNRADFTVSPSSGSFTNGATQSFSIFTSLDNNYNAASADFYYNSTRFQYVGVDYGTSFPQGRSASKGSNGYGSYIAITGSKNSGNLTGKKLLATVKFKMRSVGSAYGNFGTTTTLLYPSKNYATSANNGSYTIVNPPSAPPTKPPTTPTPKPPTTPAPKPPSTPTPTRPPSTSPITPTPSSPSVGAPIQSQPSAPTSMSAGTTTSKTTSASSRKSSVAASKRTSKSTRPTTVIPQASKPSASGLAISDLKIDDIDYRGATLTWKTNSPSTTKVNYGTNKEDLYKEQKEEKKTTEHRIQLTKENLKAGSRYYIRVSSDDDKGPVTIDGDFYTKFIPVIIKVTDESQKPLVDVEVASGETNGITNENGETLLELPEGDIVIYAQKDDLSRELSATIDLPSGEDLQRITLSMTPDSGAVVNDTNTDKKKLSIGAIVAIIFSVILFGFGIFVLFMRWKNSRSNTSEDPLEAEVHIQHIVPTAPPAQPTTLKRAAPQQIQTQDPVFAPVQNQTVQRYTSLPELVGRYGTQEAASSTPSQKPTPTLTQAPHQNMNVVQQPQQQTVQPITPQQMQQVSSHPAQQPTQPQMQSTQQQPAIQHLQQPPRHVSLKELVHNEPTSQPSISDPVNDLPVAPTSSFEPGHFDRPRNNQSADGSLTINHEE